MKSTKSETTFNFWPGFSDVFISLLFIVILFFFLLLIKVYLLEIIDVKSVKNELMRNIKNSLKADSTIIAGDTLSGNNHTIKFKDSFLFDQGKAEFKDAKSEKFIITIAREIKKFVEANKITEIVVEGHTNSDPIKFDEYGNWSLSASRAVTVVKTLDKVGIVKAFLENSHGPTRVLSVAGFSQYDYIRNKNNSMEDKEASKRIQISIKYRVGAGY